jgi:trk system potassium uptake protein TrkH
MLRRALDLPVLVILMGIGSAMMLLPAAHAAAVRDFAVARPFFYGGLILLIFTAMIGLATANRTPRDVAQSHLAALAGAYLVLPVLLAIPFHQAIRDTTFLNAWFEMLSSFTTTGASVYDGEGRLSPSLHLWRAVVGWLGGFFALVMAMAVLAPLNLGGIEVLTGKPPGKSAEGAAQITRIADPSERLTRQTAVLFPTYAGLTVVLWVLLLMAGGEGLWSLCQAMSTLSTSGILPGPGTPVGTAGVTGEALVAVFLIFSLSRRTLPGAVLADRSTPLWRDPELRLAAICVAGVAGVLMLRHWIGAIQSDTGGTLSDVARALWGSLFTALSFLTTTGMVSQEWGAVRMWSGMEHAGMILLGLAIVGGGVATTAGGVKLLRVYALFRHGERELEKIVHPNSVGGAGQAARLLRREGAYLAWLFFMLFALSIAVITGALGLTGIEFEPALVLTLSALTTTGQLATHAGDSPILYGPLPGQTKVVLGFAMVLGRVETLALLALFTPFAWRR